MTVRTGISWHITTHSSSFPERIISHMMLSQQCLYSAAQEAEDELLLDTRPSSPTKIWNFLSFRSAEPIKPISSYEDGPFSSPS